MAHYLADKGLGFQDHYSIFMENNNVGSPARPVRRWLYFTCINSFLTSDELAYIINNSESQILITSMSKLEAAQGALAQCAAIKEVLVVGAGDVDLPEGMSDFASTLSKYPDGLGGCYRNTPNEPLPVIGFCQDYGDIERI